MTTSVSIHDNNLLKALSLKAGPQITHAIKKASAQTGVNFSYLMEQAAAESDFDSEAKAKTSSAQGLYQFIDSTWLRMIKSYGHKHNLANLANKISEDGTVKDTKALKDILDLRNDPEVSALLAGEFAAENKQHLEKTTRGNIGSTELYLAHFLGATGASSFINALNDNPLNAAADLFPKAANSNRNVFYNKNTGKPRTLVEIYDFFDKKFNGNSMNFESTQKHDSMQPSHYSPRPLMFNRLAHENALALQDVLSSHNSYSSFDSYYTAKPNNNTQLISALSAPVSFGSDLFFILAGLETPQLRASSDSNH